MHVLQLRAGNFPHVLGNSQHRPPATRLKWPSEDCSPGHGVTPSVSTFPAEVAEVTELCLTCSDECLTLRFWFLFSRSGLACGGQNKPPKDAHILTPRTCDYVTFHGQKGPGLQVYFEVGR